MQANRFEISQFKCKECGSMFPLPRAKARKRKEGHIKDLWCPFCKQKVKTIEYKPNTIYKTMSNEIIGGDKQW